MKRNNTVETRKNIIFSDTSSVYSEAFQHLQINLDFSFVDGQKKMIAITSPLPKDGKSTIACNLAYIYAKKDFKVLLVDLDLRKPCLHRFFKIDRGMGITDYCTKNLKKEDIIQHVMDNVDFISSGSQSLFPGKVLESESLLKLFEDIKDDYDYIFIDTPPVLPSSDAILCSRIVNKFLVVTSYRKTKKNDLDELFRQFKNNKIEVIGVVLNHVKKDRKSSYNYYYQYKE